eukprot:TRINITY_DN13148_c0_g1_i1.p1 TRINITY_DN13148_c0_g1~~TRINITY_DN13148_c0_g1_i1.p1  ORF type:complete len:414 (-),score=84.07 TRINITY_DN13148_c0_g1_i1:100-1341(-)
MTDVVIIGGGVVGCALLRELALSGVRCTLLEKASSLVSGASSGNSGMLHTGFDSTPGTLEQRLVKKGYEKLRTLHNAVGLPVNKTGALLTAWTDEELAKLDEVIQRAKENDVRVIRLSPEQIHKREPFLSPGYKGAILVEGEWTVDPFLLPMFYALQASLHDAKILTNWEVSRASFSNNSWILKSTNGQQIQCKWAINCAGLFGDRVESLRTKNIPFNILPRKGQFVVFKSSPLNHMILPLPTEKTKGIIVYPSIYGQLVVGPTATETEERESPSTDKETLQKLREIAKKLVPSLGTEDCLVSYAGVRPATEFKDYQICAHPKQSWITVGGIRSTGLTASLSIAEYVASLLTHNWSELPQKLRIPESELVEEGKKIVSLLKQQSVSHKFQGVNSKDGVFYAASHPLHKVQARL